MSLDAAEFVGFEVAFDDLDVLDAEETVYGLNPSDDDDGLTLAGCVFDLLINVAFDMIGATFELLSFFVALAGAVDVDGSSSSGMISDEFIAFDDDV